MKYKLVAVDMDGTLLDSRGHISPETIRSIEALENHGILFVITTGRPIQGVAKYKSQLALKGPVITYNGAMILQWKTGDVLFQQNLLARDARKILELGQRYDVTMCVWANNQLYGNRLDGRIHKYKSLSGVEPKLLPQDSLPDITKILWYDEPDRIQRIQRSLSPSAFREVSYCTSKPEFLEFFSSRVSKAAALERIGRLYHIRREEMIAIGDGINDLSMIEYAGLGVAMDNAEAEVKSRSQYITASNDQNGVQKVLERFCL